MLLAWVSVCVGNVWRQLKLSSEWVYYYCALRAHMWGEQPAGSFLSRGDVWRGEGHQYYTACTDAAVEMYVVFKEYSSSISIGTEKMCVALGLPKKHYHCYQQPYYYLYVQDVRRRDPPSLLSSTWQMPNKTGSRLTHQVVAGLFLYLYHHLLGKKVRGHVCQ